MAKKSRMGMSFLHTRGTLVVNLVTVYHSARFFSSSVVEKVLLAAHDEGRRFSVIVADSRPLLEGKLFSDLALRCF